MTRTKTLIASCLLWIAVACSPSEPAATTTTTTVAPVSNSGSTTITTEPTTLGGGEDFQTHTPGTLVVGTERLTAPWYISPGSGIITGGFEYDLA